MLGQKIRDARTSNASIVAHLRHIQAVVLPSCHALIERSDQRRRESIGLDLASTQRILDPEVALSTTPAQRSTPTGAPRSPARSRLPAGRMEPS